MNEEFQLQLTLHGGWEYGIKVTELGSWSGQLGLEPLFRSKDNISNTPGTWGWSRLRDRTMAVAKNRAKMTFFSGVKKNYLKKIFFFAYIF